jgi:hemolysin D
VDFLNEVEAFLENEGFGFVEVCQIDEIKVETFRFTRYGTLSGSVSDSSQDAVFRGEQVLGISGSGRAGSAQLKSR